MTAVLDVLDGIEKNGISLTRCLELGAQWDESPLHWFDLTLVADDLVQRPGGSGPRTFQGSYLQSF